jgi:hypothetical protein
LAGTVEFNPSYASYKNEVLAFVTAAKRDIPQKVAKQNEDVTDLQSLMNRTLIQVNNAYSENSVKLTNTQREKYLGDLNDYYTNFLGSRNDFLKRNVDFIKQVQRDYNDRIKIIVNNLEDSRTALSHLQGTKENPSKTKQFNFEPLPFSSGGGDSGVGNDYYSVGQTIPPPDKPSADWGFVGAMSSWLTDTTSLNLAIIIGMLGFGIFGAGISTFITKEVESTDRTLSVLESMTRVIVKGFSAALIIYLGAKSGLALANNSNSDPNPYFLYFSCLAGAVFSDRIWDWARSIIDKNYNANVNQDKPKDKTTTS